MELKDKVTIITGAGSGIGRASAKLFAKEGAKVIIADIDESGSNETISHLSDHGLFIRTDVSQESDVRQLIDSVGKQFNKIDIVVNSVGTYSPLEADIVSLPTGDFDKVMATNFRSVFLLSKFATTYLLKSKGSMINIASALGLIPEAESPVYCASKAAMIMWTKATALNYAKQGVRIYCICPGPIDTPLLWRAFPKKSELKAYLERNPMGRAGTPDEVAQVALFLASSISSYVTGGIYTVDGGEALA